MKRCGIHWDSLGNSKGTADLEFYKAEDASKAIEEYHSNLSYFLLIFIYFLEARINDEIMEVKFSTKILIITTTIIPYKTKTPKEITSTITNKKPPE